MAEVVVAWVQYNKTTGFNKAAHRRRLEDSLNLMVTYFSGLDPQLLQSRAWKQAYKIAMNWQNGHKLSRRQLATLISITLEKSIR